LKKIVYILIFTVSLLWASIALISFINRKVPQTQKIKSVTALSANKIDLNSEIDLKKFDHYIEKAINITGEIKDIKEHETHYTLILKANNKTSIICKMQDDQIKNINTLQIGETITIKGIYKGYLIDMILLNCIII